MKPSRSNSRFWQWWWKGSTSHNGLATEMTAHVEGILDHAADIQRAAERDGQRIRHAAFDSATRLLARVEAVEAELQQALEAVNAGKLALMEGMNEERARMQQEPASITPLVRAS
jgi:hypothetical protein